MLLAPIVVAALVAPAAAHPNKQPVCRSNVVPKLTERIWDRGRWERGPPKARAVKAVHKLIGCARHPGPLLRKWERERAAYGLYRAYRLVAPYPGYTGQGYWLRWLSVPRYIVDCETNGSYGDAKWTALNPSGAQGPAQLLGWNAPYPARTDKERLAYWRTAAYVLSVQGLSAWACA